MRRAAVAGVALASVAAFTGASAAPAAAPVAETKEAHTLKWRLAETAFHKVGKNRFVSADTIRSAGTRKIVGYSTSTIRAFPKTNSASIQVAAAVKGGILVGRVRGTFDSDVVVFRGPILNGTGKFKGAEGTIVAKGLPDDKTLVRISYNS